MEKEKSEEELIMERLIEDAKNYSSGFEAALDHVNMGYVHLFKQLDGNDETGLLSEMKELSQKLINIILDNTDEGPNI
jgi:hypothetical protein